MKNKALYISLALLTVALFLGLFDVGMAHAEPNEAKSMLDAFEQRTSGWWTILQAYAIDIFILTLTLEIVLFGIRMAMQHTQVDEIIGQFIMLLLFAGFIAAVIVNYEDWAKTIALTGLKPIVAALNPGLEVVDAGKPFAMAAQVFSAVMDAVEGAGWRDIPKVLVLYIIALIIAVILALISALVILITCEFLIVANVGILLIGLGGSKLFKEYAISTMKYIFAVGLKLFVLQLVCNIGFSIITTTSIANATMGGIKVIEIQDLFILVAQAIILLALAKSLPDTVGGILSGTHVGGGNPLMSAARSAGAAAMGGAGMALAAAKTGGSLKSSWSTAGQINSGEGKSGFSNRLRTMAGAKAQGNMEKNRHTMNTQLKSQLASQQALKSAGKE